MKPIQQITLPAVLLLGFLSLEIKAADWPQFRYDANRSAASPEQLSAELHLQWVREYPKPRPAFPTESRLRYDATYEPVAVGKTLFVPSMITDSVTALDTDTGAKRWQFIADGPVRFAPVAWQNKVYFASDDGYLYCLKAGDGTLLWKFRGLPSGRKDRKILGNKRLVSLWPARGGPVLADGVVYFAAGIWPSTGIFIHALDAKTGKAVWSNIQSHHIAKANLDHGIKGYAGLTPQGYLAIVDDKLVVPCGAQLPGFLDLKTGKLLSYTMGWGGRVGLPKGSWFVAGTGNYLVHSGDLFDLSRPNQERFKKSRGRSDFKNMLYPGGFTRVQIDRTNQKTLGHFRQPVLTQQTMFYNLANQAITATDLSRPKLEERSKKKVPAHRRNDQYPDKEEVSFPEKWRLRSKHQVHIKAGTRLYVGGPGVVEAIDLPTQGEQPKVSWHAQIEGTPQRMLAADGKLFVATSQGHIYAFGKKKIAEAALHKEPTFSAASYKDASTQTAAQILKESNVNEGYALVLGIHNGRLAEELVWQSKCYVIAVDSDAKKVASLRKRLIQAGLYGSRISVHVGNPLEYPFPPYLANLVVSENLGSLSSSLDRALAEKIFHPIRPYGGMACLSIAAPRKEAFVKKLSKWKLAGAAVRQTGDLVVLSRPGPLPGAQDWSHRGSNSANAGASQDEFLKPPLGLLWFDSSQRWHRKPGSAVIRVAGGRVLIQAGNLKALDVFTGRLLWETKLPPNANSRKGDEMVVLEDAIYITSGKTCLVLDSVTGRETNQIKLPDKLDEQPTGNWTNLHVEGDYLVGVSGKHLVCVDRHSGKMLWTFQSQQSRISIALGPEKVFFAEVADRRKPKAARGKTRTLALDIKTGKIVWQKDGGSLLRYSAAHDLLVTSRGIFKGKDGTRLRDNTAAWTIIGDRMIGGDNERLVMYDLLSGAKTSKEFKWARRGCTGLRACQNLATTRYHGNVAYIDFKTNRITPFWNIRPACNNNLVPANGVLSIPNLTGGCTCNYTPTSLAFVPVRVIDRGANGN